MSQRSFLSFSLPQQIFATEWFMKLFTTDGKNSSRASQKCMESCDSEISPHRQGRSIFTTPTDLMALRRERCSYIAILFYSFPLPVRMSEQRKHETRWSLCSESATNCLNSCVVKLVHALAGQFFLYLQRKLQLYNNAHWKAFSLLNA